MNILAFADLHGQKSSMAELTRKSKRAGIIIAAGDLSVFSHHLEKVMGFLHTFSQPVLVLHGNHEEPEDIIPYIRAPHIHFLHGSSFVFQNILFLGWGGGGFALADRQFERTAYKKFSLLAKRYKKVVFVTHQPPYGTKLDFIYGYFAGNKSFRSFILKVHPTIAISGHLHETAKKKDILGKTLLVNPGHDGMLLSI